MAKTIKVRDITKQADQMFNKRVRRLEAAVKELTIKMTNLEHQLSPQLGAPKFDPNEVQVTSKEVKEG